MIDGIGIGDVGCDPRRVAAASADGLDRVLYRCLIATIHDDLHTVCRKHAAGSRPNPRELPVTTATLSTRSG
jgi:hypothetical protein